MFPANKSLAVPFVRQLDGQMHPGRIIAVYGMVPHGARSFEVNLQCGEGPDSDIAMHISVRFTQQVVVFNTFTGDWQDEQREGEGNLPLHHGSPFNILVLCERNQCKVAFNGQHFATFEHRLSFGRVSHIGVKGDVQINSISGIVKNIDGTKTVNPSVPFVQSIGPLFPGHLIRVQGRIPNGEGRFKFNLMAGPSEDNDDVILHVSVRAAEGVVELNTKSGGKGWDSAHPVRPCPVSPGQPFELLILLDNDDYKVVFNGAHFTEFPYRMPCEKVKYLNIDGAVTVHMVYSEGHDDKDGGVGFSTLPPPSDLPVFSNPYDEYDHKYYFFPNPYPIMY